jgi:hypothetical protein
LPQRFQRANRWMLVVSLMLWGCSGNNAPALGQVDWPPTGSDAETIEAAAVDAGADTTSTRHDGALDGDAAPRIPDDGDWDVLGSGDTMQVDVVDAARPSLCQRLVDPMRPNDITVLAESVDKEYVLRVYRDCNVSKMARTEMDSLFEFYNDLLEFSLALWGCTKDAPTQFGLRRAGFLELTSADAARLIDYYVGAATSLLQLDTNEASRMRADLTRLAGPAITRQAEDFALSMCAGDAGIDGDGQIEGSGEAGGFR